jgi:LCP family protein required for cell wall assembly
MIITSYDPTTRSLAMLSIPGNLWVTVPGYGQTEIAQAYADGGVRLALLTVESATHIAIPYYTVTGANGFRQMIDAFGGVRLHIPSFAAGHVLGDQTVGSGTQSLDGAATLAFARLSIGGARPEMSEMQRMQDIFLALRQQGFSAANLVRVPSIVTQVAGSISTNFPLDQVSDLARAVSRVPASSTSVVQIDFANRAVSAYGGGLLLPDWQRIQSIAQSLFPYHSAGPPIDVLNGTGISGQAGSVADFLGQDHIPVRATGSAPSFAYSQTKVLLRAGAGSEAITIAHEVASLLQAPVVTGSVHSARSAVVLIVGGDYQDLTQQ